MRHVTFAFEAKVRADPAAWDQLIPFARDPAVTAVPGVRVLPRACAADRPCQATARPLLGQPGGRHENRQRARDA